MSLASRSPLALAIPIALAPLLVAGTAVLTPMVAHAATPTVKAPPTKALPAGLDIAASYQGQTTCSPTPKPGTLAFAQLMSSHYGLGTAAYGISRSCDSGVTEHSEGRAYDWMVNSADAQQKAVADSVVAWLSAPDSQGRPGAMARRFGIMYIIWNRKMWRAYDPARGWAPYVGTSPHTDHIHFSFSWDGAYQRTSWWTGVPLSVAGGPVPTTPTVPTPSRPVPVTGYPTLRQGSRGSDVVLLQRVVKVGADGAFGPVTDQALRAWQASNHLPVTGVADGTTWYQMLTLHLVPARVKVPAPVSRPTLDRPAPRTSNAPATPRAGAPGVATVSTTTAYTALKGTTLRAGSTGTGVRVLQRALGGLVVDGSFGSATGTKLAAYRRSVGLAAVAVADRAVWEALERRDHPLLRYRTTVLRKGSTGVAVTALQRALRVGADGSFGSGTEAAVKAVQRRAGLSQTGVVASLTWQAVEARLA